MNAMKQWIDYFNPKGMLNNAYDNDSVTNDNNCDTTTDKPAQWHYQDALLVLPQPVTLS